MAANCFLTGDHPTEAVGYPSKKGRTLSSEKTEALVIKQTDFSESSRIVTFYTRDWGKVSVIAKGAKRLKNPFEAALDLLAVSRIVFLRKSSSSLDILTEAQLVSRFRPNGRNLGSLYGGYYVAELLLGLTEEYDPHVQLYDDAVAILGHLSDGNDEKLSILRFEFVMLREIGQLPSLDECIVCNRPAETFGPVAYWVSQGGVICNACQKHEYKGIQVQAGTLVILRRLAGPSQTPLRNLVVSRQQLRELRCIATASISYVLERSPKMLRYIPF